LYNLIKRTLVTIDEKERRKINSGEPAQADEKAINSRTVAKKNPGKN